MGVVFSSSSCCASSSVKLGGTTTTVMPGTREDALELGHTFSYLPSVEPPPGKHQHHSFSAISGASVSANPSPSGCVLEGSSSFSVLPLWLPSHPSQRSLFLSEPIGRPDFRGRGSFSDGTTMKRQRSGFRNYHLRRSASEKSRPPSVFPMWYVGSKDKFCRDVTVRGCDVADGGRGKSWVCGKAGEDRVHVVVSEHQRWLFVGIYDGFNGSDAPEFLVRNLYHSVFNQLNGLLSEGDREQKRGGERGGVENGLNRGCSRNRRPLKEFLASVDGTCGNDGNSLEWVHHDRKEHDEERRLKRTKRYCSMVDHDTVLGILSRAMEMTELEYVELTDEAAMNGNPELSLTGSCVLTVLVVGEDVYVLNIGDSRAIVGQHRHAAVEGEAKELEAVQLSIEHCTSNPEEVQRILEEHPDDPRCITNGRIKGRLKVTRAFGAGYLKQPKWNSRLLKVFRNEYVGTRPYISSSPSLYHHKLGSNDRFLVLSSDGLYQYFTNEEVVSHVGSFIESFPYGDPAQNLIEELLLRAAKNAGMDFHELLEIPHGERRKFHDDVIVMVVSVEGKIWKSSG